MTVIDLIHRVLQSSAPQDNEKETGVSMMCQILPRVIGLITFLSGMSILVMAWKRREGMFHRLALGMSIHMILGGIFNLVGPAAAPPMVFGGSGTIVTCSLQGFMIYIAMFSPLLYYASLCICSYVGVLNNFKHAKIDWIEKYIHCLANIFPLGAGIFLLAVEAINYSDRFGFCAPTSYPDGCQNNPDIECERGPQTWNGVRLTHIIPEIFALVFPTCVMSALVVTVARRRDQIYITATSVALQAILYITPIYICVLPQLLGWYIPELSTNKKPYIILVNFALSALWILLVYFYFSAKKKNTIGSNEQNRISQGKTIRTTSSGIQGDGAETTQISSTTAPIPYSFNIFDGTNASGAFAAFIHEGDSEDMAVDNAETKRWVDIQDHL